jgi:hypothetical protein
MAGLAISTPPSTDLLPTEGGEGFLDRLRKKPSLPLLMGERVG